MDIELEIGVYDENSNKPQVYQKHKFDSIDDAIGLVDFLKMAYNAINDSKGLVVRLDERSKVFLLDYESQLPLRELKSDLLQKYSSGIPEASQIDYTSTLSKNSNFDFKEDETVQYAQTSLGNKLPFKIFSPDSEKAFSNMLTNTKELGNGDFALLERQFSENKNLQFYGTEKITNLNDIAFLFKSLEDEAVEHAFLLYDFKDKGYFVQHISSGAFNSALVDPKSFLGNVMEAKPHSITLVHNHPSGNLVVSGADRDIFSKIKAAIEHTDIAMNDGIIINLRSGKYVQFNESDGFRIDLNTPSEGLQSIPTYSFSKQVFVEDYHPSKISSSQEIAKFINSQKFGVSDKTELLVLNQQLQIVGKFLMPQKDDIDFILNKVLKFGGTRAVLYGNNITPELVNNYNSILKPSGVDIMDGIQFKSENSTKMYKSFADEGTLRTYEPEVTFEATMVKEDSSINTSVQSNSYLTLDEIYQEIPADRIGDDFYIKVSKEEAEYLLQNGIVEDVMNKEYGDDDHWVGMTKDDFDEETNKFDNDYQTFELNVYPITKDDLQFILSEIESFSNKQVEKFILPDLQIKPEQRSEFSHAIEYGNSDTAWETKADYTLSTNQLKAIPDYIDGWFISDMNKHNLVYDKLSFDDNFVSYEIKDNMILKTELDRNLNENVKTLNNNEIQFTNQNNLKMENIRENYVSSFLKELYETPVEDSHLLKESYSKLNDNERELFKNNIVELIIKEYPNILLEKSKIETQKDFNKLFNTLEPTVIMEKEKEFDTLQYLKNQMKYMGFGDDAKLHNDLKAGIEGDQMNFQIKLNSDKVLEGNTVEFTLNYQKSTNGGVYLNTYDTSLTNSKGETIEHKFTANKDNYFTAKEAINLMEGRAVKNEFLNPKTQQTETAFFKLNLDEPKIDFGNYTFQTFYKNYGVDTNSIVDKSNIIFDKPEYKETTIASLEKGNVVKVKFELDNKIVEGKAVLNPQYKNLSLYDNDMTRINTNKALEGIDNGQSKQKGNVREQGISRGL